MVKYMASSVGDGFSRYLFEYRHDGSEWGIEIVATSPQDAQDRLKAISWAHYKGEIAAKIPAPGGGLIKRLFSRRAC
jgi:hypothetical protein